LVGVEHVALGSDFDGSVWTAFDATGLVLITEALLDGGFTEGEVRAVMGENVLRILSQVLP
jgi:microsomal dipeptidase-like Zn-dependent dipeptidase